MSHSFTLTREADARVRRSLEAVLSQAVAPERLGQLELYSDEEEDYLRRNVSRLLWEPKLPNAGAQERLWLKDLEGFARDPDLVIALKLQAARYAAALKKCLPEQEVVKRDGQFVRLPGCYYTRKPVTPASSKELWKLATELRREATEAQDWKRQWLADFLLAGVPQAVSNFRMECLYLLRAANGTATRLVRLVNTKGEKSLGDEVNGMVRLPNEMGSSAEKFRQWVQSMGNFTWGCEGGAGNVELQLLQLDVTEDVAYRTVQLVETAGWYELRSARGKGERVTPGQDLIRGLWFTDGCVIQPDGQLLLPDKDGIYWFEGEGYALSRKGREVDFVHGLPWLHPDLSPKQLVLDTSVWEPEARQMYERGQILGGFFRETCRRFAETVGGLDGWLAVGSMLAYAAAPEVFARRCNFPGLWMSGQMGSGKTVFASWLTSLQGFRVSAGIGLISRNVTPVFMACQLENYSNLAPWFDEFRQHQLPMDKEPFLRDSYNRQLGGKWTPDGVQRVIRTAPLVTGESTSSDAATRSRYPHVLLSEQKRQANHYDWMMAHQEYFGFFFRALLERRKDFVELTLKGTEMWLGHEDLQRVPSRDRVTHAVGYAAFAAASVIFESHTADEVVRFRKHMAQMASAASADVMTDVNVHVFVQDMVTAYQQGALPNELFRVALKRLEHPPGAPNQTWQNGYGYWESCVLYFEPRGVVAALQMWLRKLGASVTLREKDLRDQMSRFDFWVVPEKNRQITMRMGKPGAKASATVWGIYVDKHPLGYQRTLDEDVQAALKSAQGTVPEFTDGDPRKGPLFTIVEGVIEADRAAQ